MAISLGREFRAQDAPPDNYDPLPAGWYDATIKHAEVKFTKSGGQMVSVTYGVVGPTHAGRVVFGNFNIQNANSEAERIGHEQLCKLAAAIGVESLTHDEQLIGGNCQIKIKIKEASGQYEARNEVNGWRSLTGSAPPQQGPPQGYAPPPAAQYPQGQAPQWQGTPAQQHQGPSPLQPLPSAQQTFPPQGQQPATPPPAQTQTPPPVAPAQPAWAQPGQAQVTEPAQMPAAQSPDSPPQETPQQ